MEVNFNRVRKYRLLLTSAFISLFSVFPVFASEVDPGEDTATISDYLGSVSTVFTWILKQVSELIAFILDNPFLAVSLVLFMCGAVISFFIRIKNS